VKSDHIPRATIKRLAMYVQVLESFKREGTQVVSSELLARTCNVNPSQIRKDLAYFGEFGVRGVGYHVQDLITAIKRSLGVDRMWKCALVGVGNLGKALLRHREFKYRGFDIVAAFDCDPFKIGEEVTGLEVVCTRRLKETARDLGIEIGLITTPPDRAQRAANFLAEAEIKGIINFAPARIVVPADVHVEYVDFFHHLYAVSFSITLDQRPKAQAVGD
jgi:redox-sensing transcriptional repressor